MGYVYFPYTVLLSILMAIDCKKQTQPKWWAGLVLLFPPVAAVFILKTRKNKAIVPITIFLITFSLVLGGESILYTNKKNNVPDIIPPIVKQIIRLNEDIKENTINLYNASGKLDSLSMIQSRETDIKSAIKLIHQLRQMVQANQMAIDRLIRFIEEREIYLNRNNLSWALAIGQFYTDPHLSKYHESRAKYLSAFEMLLEYTLENFQNIMELQSQKHMKNYDAYYLSYRIAADNHNRVSKKFIAFQTKIINAYPEVKPFLPGAHQFVPFKFWDKFSF